MAHHAVSVSLQLRWGDMDINNHINNVAIARLLEESRVRAMPRLIAGPSIPRTDDASSNGTGLVVARQEIEFLASIPYSEDAITAEVWLSRVGRSSFEFSVVLTDPHGTRFAQSETTMVCVGVDGSPAGLPDDLAAAMRERVSEPVGLRRRA